MTFDLTPITVDPSVALLLFILVLLLLMGLASRGDEPPDNQL